MAFDPFIDVHHAPAIIAGIGSRVSLEELDTGVRLGSFVPPLTRKARVS
jgi:hypothetical protein